MDKKLEEIKDLKEVERLLKKHNISEFKINFDSKKKKMFSKKLMKWLGEEATEPKRLDSKKFTIVNREELEKLRVSAKMGDRAMDYLEEKHFDIWKKVCNNEIGLMKEALRYVKKRRVK